MENLNIKLNITADDIPYILDRGTWNSVVYLIVTSMHPENDGKRKDGGDEL